MQTLKAWKKLGTKLRIKNLEITGDGMEVPDYGIYESEKWSSVKKGAAAMITRMDSDVGKIINLLEELKLKEPFLFY